MALGFLLGNIERKGRGGRERAEAGGWGPKAASQDAALELLMATSGREHGNVGGYSGGTLGSGLFLIRRRWSESRRLGIHHILRAGPCRFRMDRMHQSGGLLSERPTGGSKKKTGRMQRGVRRKESDGNACA